MNRPKISIFNFDNYRDYLIAAGMPDGHYSHTKNNLQNWAKRLGYKSASSLTMVLKGQRLPSLDMIQSLVKDLGLESNERNYFELLVRLERAKQKNKDTSDILEEISKIPTLQNNFSLSLKEFSTISEWYYIVIKQLISSPGFVNDLEWIYRKLRKKVSLSQIQSAIDNLIELNIIEETEDGNLKVLKSGLITTNDIPSSAIRRHHFGMITKGLEALEEQPVEQRQISGITMKVKEEDLPRAKEFIFDFLKKFNAEFSTNQEAELYQLNTQFFTHTQESLKQ